MPTSHKEVICNWNYSLPVKSSTLVLNIILGLAFLLVRAMKSKVCHRQAESGL